MSQPPRIVFWTFVGTYLLIDLGIFRIFLDLPTQYTLIFISTFIEWIHNLWP